MPDSPPLCGTHTAYIYERGGDVLVGELESISVCRWNRIRDNISTGFVRIPAGLCCELLADAQVILHELHIYRSGELVWCGPITRLEFEWDGTDVYAEDLLWVAKRRALDVGYNHAYPPNGEGPTGALDLADHLMIDTTYGVDGDPWNMLGGIHHIAGPTDPQAQRVANSWAVTTWEELDALAEDYGIDYTVVARELFYFDVHLNWLTLPDLLDGHLAEWPRIVEYGNSFATRYIRTDGSGYAGMAEAPDAVTDVYGHRIDYISTVNNQVEDTPIQDPTTPSPETIAGWVDTASEQISKYHPPRMSVVVPANARLMPASPWNVNTLVPGSWFMVYVERDCKTLNEWQRLHEMRVEEVGGQSEFVAITTASAPASMVVP